MGWLAGYNFRKKITVQGVLAAQTNYQIPLTLIAGPGSDSGSTVHLEGNSLSAMDDVRFTTNDEVTPLDYWVEAKNETSKVIEPAAGLTDFNAGIGFIQKTAIYKNGVTYIAYDAGQGADVNKIKVLTYTHATSVFSTPVVVVATGEHDYGRPSITIDANGRIHIFSEPLSPFVQGGQIIHYVSTNPYDISAWVAGTVPAATNKSYYPNSLTDSAGNIFLIFVDVTVANNAKIQVRKSTDNGVTWANPLSGPLVDFGALLWLRTFGATIDASDTIRFSWGKATANDNSEPLIDIYYIEGVAAGTVWRKANGAVLATPATLITADKVFASAGLQITRVGDIQTVPLAGNVYMLCGISNVGNTFMEFYLAKHNGVNWSTTKISAAGNTGAPYEAWGFIDVTDANNVTAYLNPAPIGVLSKWATTNGGTTWAFVSNITSTIATGSLDRILHADPGFQFFWQRFINYTMGVFGTAFGTSSVWVEVDSIPASPGVADIYIYYGKAGDVSASNGYNTFIAFDDFERGVNGGAIGGNWTNVAGSVVISTDQAFTNPGSTRSAKWTAAATIPEARFPLVASTNQAIRARVFIDGLATAWTVQHSNGTKAMDTILNYDGGLLVTHIDYYDGALKLTGVNIVVNAWQLFEWKNFSFAGGTYDILKENSVAKAGATMFNGGVANVVYMYLGDLTVGRRAYVDNLIVRNFVPTEPTWSVFGPQLTAPTAQTDPATGVS